MDNEILEMMVSQAIGRIKDAYEQAEGKMYLSFSGGKDSTIVAELIKMSNLPVNIPFVFANTGIELDATYNFVKDYNYSNIITLKPRKPFGQVLKEYGKPAISKNKSEWLSTHQNNKNEPLRTVRQRQLILGEVEKGGIKKGFRSKNALSLKHFHFIHPELEYKISNKCCSYMKKKPFEDYTALNDMAGTYTGIRVAEGGARAMAYKSCTITRKVKGKDNILSMPIIDWTDEICDEFIEKYNIKLSDAYTVYGMNRTG